MKIEPASIEQIRLAADGRMVTISADASTVAADLRRIDKGLKVRFAENAKPPFWAVYYESEDGRTTYLVLTAKAYQTTSGTWTGLDGRIVRRVQEIDPEGRSGYDYADALQKARLDRQRQKKQEFHEKIGDAAERTAHALRKDLGEPYRGRIFKPRDIPAG